MKFPDKPTSNRQVENGQPTDTFELFSQTRKDSEVLRATLANVALIAFQSETPMEPEDARLLLDFMRLDQRQQEHLIVDTAQAERIAKLIRQGGSSVMPEILENQFTIRKRDEANQIDDEELTRVALTIADHISEEAHARMFWKELDDSSLDDFLGPVS